MNTIDILTIGNLTEDINIINNKMYTSIGGTSFYAYKVAEKLGYDLRIVTEISEKLNVAKKINPKKIISQKAQLHTIFENTYLKGKSNQKVLNAPGKIISSILQQMPSKILKVILFEKIAFKIFFAVLATSVFVIPTTSIAVIPIK